ncbi:protein FAM32A-like [Scyliorhinus canicula]|uniref:protein FAM32A-like n=1 Tax=Scyliorhinus canicula TaxID=7830 RepID=UPI0018F48E1F|nr:protein FAM32A-like [Scyliorhinus canicula]
MAEYESVQTGALKLKGVAQIGVKKKKKKTKESKKMLEQIISNQQQHTVMEEAGEHKRVPVDKRTLAQKAFDKMQEKRQIERILKKASKTHKQSVEEFNRHLDTLTEHYDIPKVSWTK